ncbi:small subunit ribosomal protein S20 [Methylomarinovum caldicuralii]|uniref:Small ribosomal subunit protein bS20 n=1 Tax=Methylomarinovum caldicuralii TaxID=438856 RepID=A0AAU9C0L0_9GAMM|nr:30S ribosomal protein S20 [Methylomarinovum caldicuralii]BCX81088.1 small subunit ribosomal protein S20 [Methylomarinovum caldicuralii]
MANIASAKKRARQNLKRYALNKSHRSRMRTFIKKAIKAVEAGDLATAQEAYRKAVPVIDSMVNKGIIHKNNAARKKSRLNARLKALAQQASA